VFVLRLDALLFLVALGLGLDVAILPWALGTTVAPHGLAHPAPPQLSGLAPHLAALLLTALLLAATLIHELGHAWVLRRLGAQDVTITFHAGGGACRAQAVDTSPRATLLAASGGPVATALLIAALVLLRTSLPLPHPDKVVLWLGTCLQVVAFAGNVLPLHPRSDGGYILRALGHLAAPHEPGGAGGRSLWRVLALSWGLLTTGAMGLVLQPNPAAARGALGAFLLLGSLGALGVGGALRRSGSGTAPAPHSCPILLW
jgi:Zn-dependent protease